MKPKILFSTLRYAVFGYGLVAMIFALLSGFLQFESGTHYFSRGAVLPILSVIFALLGVICAIVVGFLNPDREPKAPSRFSYLPGMIGFFDAFFFFLFPLVKQESEGAETAVVVLIVVSSALLLLSAVFCLLSFLLKSPRFQGLLALFSLFPILAPAVFAFFYYFEGSLEKNAPLKTVLQTGLLFAMFLFLFEARRLLGKPVPRLFYGLRLAFFPTASIAVGMILSAFFSGFFQNGTYLLGALLLLFLQFALLFDLFPLTKKQKDQ